MRLKPMKDLIYVKVYEPGYTGLIELPKDIYDSSGSYAEVKAVGPECEELKVGDHIIHKRVTGLKFSFEDEEYMAMHEPEVLAVVG